MVGAVGELASIDKHEDPMLHIKDLNIRTSSTMWETTKSDT